MSGKIGIDALNKYNLFKVCNWKYIQNVAIEHHYSTESSLIITYFDIRKIQRGLKRILSDVKLSLTQFIGISSDIPIFCIPSLILGIISSGYAFVYLSTESQDLLLQNTHLNIKYVIVPKNSSRLIGERIIKRFVMHKQSLVLKKVSNKRVKHQRQTKSQNIHNTNCFAYAVTTSGSTGIPSVVRVTHASIVSNILDLKRIFKLTNCDKMVHLTPLTFDPSIIEIFLSMSSGATLLTVSDELKNNPSELLTVLEKNCATILSSTPSILLHRWSASKLKSTLLKKNSKLRILILGGEPFPSSQTVLKMKHPENHTRIFNIYGITEVSCWASIDEIPFNQDENTIKDYNNLGTVLSNTVFQVRSETDNSIIKKGEGILYIGSFTRICAIDNENIHHLNLPVFRNTGDLVTVDSDGEIKLIGRQDSCVKRFGAKLYLNKLECHVKQLNFVEDCHAIFIRNSSTLHFFFTAIYNKQQLSNDEENRIIDELWDHVRVLPTLMRPDYIHYLERFVITKHGKVCNKVLKKLSMIKERNSDVGILFESIWKNQLPIVGDDKLSRFIDTGGTSIMALEIFGKLIDNLEHEFPDLVGMLLENKTLSECRDYVVEQYKKINISSNESNRYYECDDTGVTAMAQNFIELQKICQWQKCRGRTIDYQSTLLDGHQTFINYNFPTSNNCGGVLKLLHIHNLSKCVDASPTVFKYSSDNEVFVSVGSHSGMICTVQVSNNQCWKVQLPNRIEATISIIDNFKGIVGSHDGFIYCIHLMTGKINWKFRTGNIVKCSAVICSRRRNVFVGSYDHFVYCLDIKNGSLVWKQPAASICATPLIHDDTVSVIFASLDGNCISMDQLTGKFRWQHHFASPIFSSPTFINKNRIVIIADVNGNVSARATDNGYELWNIKISEYIFADLATISNHDQLDGFMIATKSGNIYRYDFNEEEFQSPRLTYKIDCKSSIFASPWIEKTLFVIALENGELRIFNVNNGFLYASFFLGGECFSSPVLYQNLIFVGCRDDNLCILTMD